MWAAYIQEKANFSLENYLLLRKHWIVISSKENVGLTSKVFFLLLLFFFFFQEYFPLLFSVLKCFMSIYPFVILNRAISITVLLRSLFFFRPETTCVWNFTFQGKNKCVLRKCWRCILKDFTFCIRCTFIWISIIRLLIIVYFLNIQWAFRICPLPF